MYGRILNDAFTRVARVQNPDALTPANALTIWRIDDIDGLLIRACHRLRPYLRWAPSLSDRDRALCADIPTALP